jgi:hypothetical protein
MHLVVGTPMYGGLACSAYNQAMLNLHSVMEAHWHKLTRIVVVNESLVPRARNRIAHLFLSTDASHLLFMDADQGFEAADIPAMIKTDKGVIAAPVPMKVIDWERVRQAALQGYQNLADFIGNYNMRPLDGHEMKDRSSPFQVRMIGSGYMLIRRDVFDQLAPYVDSYREGTQRIRDFFSAKVVDDELLPEDFHFCHLYRQHGGEVWAAPWARVVHFGGYAFASNYATAAAFDQRMKEDTK